MGKMVYVIRFRGARPDSKEEYWIGENCQRRYHTYAMTTSCIGMAKVFQSEKVAEKSAETLNFKCSNKGRFDVVPVPADQEGERA